MCPFIIFTKPSYHLFSQFIVALQGYKQLLTTKKKKRRENVIRACISFYLDKRVMIKVWNVRIFVEISNIGGPWSEI